MPDSVLNPPSAIGQVVTYTRTVFIPANAPGGAVLIITPRALDVNGQPGAASPFRITVRRGAPPVPLVPVLDGQDEKSHARPGDDGLSGIGRDDQDVPELRVA